MGFGKTNPNSISENKVLHFFDGRDQWIQRCKKITFAIVRFFASDQIAPQLGFLAERTQFGVVILRAWGLCEIR
jgi:hypothetical protein